jgi:predicted  nucleic acid-binding Zn-ribbon protein
METSTSNPKPESVFRKLINMVRKLFNMEVSTNISKPGSMPKKLFEDAVDDAQYLVAYAASKCRGKIDEHTLKTLVNAKRLVEDKQHVVSADFEAEFWLAYQDIWELVRPVTAESIKATERHSRSTVTGYIIFAFSFLILLLILQIYWVIGNQLNTQLDDLLQKQTEYSQKIIQNNNEFKAIELRFKQADVDSGNFEANGKVYTFYSSLNWERDTLANSSVNNQLQSDIASLNAQLERSSAILLTWSSPWNWLINKGDDGYTADIKKINVKILAQDKKIAEDPDGSKAAQKEIGKVNSQIKELEKSLLSLQTNPEANTEQITQINSQIDKLKLSSAQPRLVAEQLINQANQDLENLKQQLAALERQQKGDASRQALLATQFVLVILASYLLPLVYGILGAATSVLRALSKKIEEVTFSEDTGIQNLLRISLGALAGIVVGWFSFLLPNEAGNFLGTVSPLAVAFLVGYNIELFFSSMDVAINRVKALQKPSSPSKDDQTPDSQNEKNNSIQK